MNIEELVINIRKDYKLQQVGKEWIEFLEYIEKLKPKVILEIGTAAGASALCMSHFTDCIITMDCATPKDQNVFKRIGENCEMHRIVSDSQSKKAITWLEEILKSRKVDLLFIDGNHLYNKVKNDFENFSSFVRPGGTIALHDIIDSHYSTNKLGSQVYKLWNEISKNSKQYKSLSTIIHNDKWGGIGIIQCQ